MPNKEIWRHLATMVFFVVLVSNIGSGQLVQTQADILNSGGKILTLHPSPSTGLIDVSPIEINNLGTNNWSWAAEQDWCSGEGTKQNPYLIKNLKIEGKNDDAIYIRHSYGVYFVIQDCELFNGDSGIRLLNVTNGRLERNNCHHNAVSGITLDAYSCYNTLIRNICSDNYESAMIGIYLMNEASNNALIQNYVYNNEFGVVLSNTCESNLIEGNYIYNNSQYGLYANNNCDENIIKSNVIWDNGLRGLYLTSSISNMIYNNAFFNNTDEILCITANFYNTSAIGNYWGDYAGSDVNHDGIGDSRYLISGSYYDNLPIINYRPIIPLFPADHTVNSSDTFILSWTIVDDSTLLSKYSIYQDGIKIVSDEMWISKEPIIFTKTALDEGEHLYTIEISDGYNAPVSDTVKVFVNPPIVDPPEEEQDEEQELKDETTNEGEETSQINEMLIVYAILAAGVFISLAIIISAIIRRPQKIDTTNALTTQDVKVQKKK